MVGGMSFFNLRQIACAIPLAAAVPDVALATQNASCPGSDVAGGPYYDPCYEFDGWTELALLSGGTIPVDGVLVLQGAFRGETPALETVALEVTVEDVAVAGALEATAFAGIVIWRPTEPWTAGSTVAIAGNAINAAADGTCVPAEIPLTGEVTIAADAGAGLSAVDIDAVVMVEQIPTISLETLACCEGVKPSIASFDCEDGTVIDFDPTQCTPTQGTGFMQLTLTGTPAAEGPVDQQIVYVLRADGWADQHAFSPMFGLAALTAAQCAAIDAVDLGTGAVVAGEPECFGQDVPLLGQHPIDPTATLSCALQTCAVNSNGDAWDLEMCTPLGGGEEESGTPTSSEGPGSEASDGSGGSEGSSGGGDGTGGQDGDKGCACDADGGGAGAAGLLALAGLGLLGRRRRR